MRRCVFALKLVYNEGSSPKVHSMPLGLAKFHGLLLCAYSSSFISGFVLQFPLISNQFIFSLTRILFYGPFCPSAKFYYT